jgi:ribulose-bisphosphate carboxylase small chain
MSSEIETDTPRFGTPAGWRFETFSYLGEMDAAQVRRQVQYVLDRGWTCAIEHVEPEHAADTSWYMWKLPLFGERNTDLVVGEPMACRNSHAGHHVRVIGYAPSLERRG